MRQLDFAAMDADCLRPRSMTVAVTRAGVGCAGVLALGGCGGVLDPAGPVAAAEKSMLIDSLAVMLVIVLPTIAATLGFAFWFRASNRWAQRRPDFVYSGRIELITWAIPALTVMFLGGLTWIGAHRLDPAEPLGSAQRPVEIEVVSLDWKWLFIYPETGVASVNRLVIPAGRPVHFTMTSASVLNTFFIPRLGGMIYTMRGMTSQLNLLADRPGTFLGQSAHFSGDGFSDMHFSADAVDAAAFRDWTAQAKRSGRALDCQSYVALARPGGNVPPALFGTADPGLFRAIVTGTISTTRPACCAPTGSAPGSAKAR